MPRGPKSRSPLEIRQVAAKADDEDRILCAVVPQRHLPRPRARSPRHYNRALGRAIEIGFLLRT
jgi:hypothetical protein